MKRITAIITILTSLALAITTTIAAIIGIHVSAWILPVTAWTALIWVTRAKIDDI